MCYDDELKRRCCPRPLGLVVEASAPKIGRSSASTVSINGRGLFPGQEDALGASRSKETRPDIRPLYPFTVFFTLLLACEVWTGCSAGQHHIYKDAQPDSPKGRNHPEIKALVIDPNSSQSGSTDDPGSNVGRNPVFKLFLRCLTA